MKKLIKMLALASVVSVMGLSAGNVMAQGRGNFDPAQFRQMRMDRMKEQLGVTDDAEWKVLETSIGKVMDAQQEVMSGRLSGMGRGGRTGGGGNNPPADQNNGGNGTSSRRSRGGIFGTPSPEAEALQKAIDDKASADVINSKLKALRDSNKMKEDKLEASQADLRKLLTPRQEAIAVLGGLLK